MKGLTCAFTGHRPSGFHFGYQEAHPDCVRLRRRLAEEVLELAENGVTTFLTGMAQGTDLWGAEAVLALRQQFPALRLGAVIPCRTQPSRWSAAVRTRYFRILEQCDEAVCLSEACTRTCMHVRNRWLVEHADVLLAVYNGVRSGGTAYTVQYALTRKKQVRILDPVTLQRTVLPGRLQTGAQGLPLPE